MNFTKQRADSEAYFSSIPCDGCTAHHKKCNRNLDQCSNCKRKGIKCTYLIVRRKRGPKTKTESMLEYCESMYASLKSQISSNSNSNPSLSSNQNINVVSNSDTANHLNYQGQLPVFSTWDKVINPMLYPIIANDYNHQIPPNLFYQSHSIPFQNFGTQINWFPYFPLFNPSQPIYINPLNFSQQDPNQKESKN